MQENGKIDDSFFAADCFHPSQKTHGVFALLLWNNMVRTNIIKWGDLNSSNSFLNSFMLMTQ